MSYAGNVLFPYEHYTNHKEDGKVRWRVEARTCDQAGWNTPTSKVGEVEKTVKQMMMVMQIIKCT